MHSHLIHKNFSSSLIVFCNGWGMDMASVETLIAENAQSKQYDIMHVNNYTSLDFTYFDYKVYDKIFLIAWSMGIYCSQALPIPFHKKIALCGTGNPISDTEGIPEKIYALTLRNFNENTAKLFAEKIGFSTDTNRQAIELQQELQAIKDYTLPKNSFFDLAYIAENDTIFPKNNQINYWQKYAKQHILIKSPHYPFNLFTSWNDIINAKPRANANTKNKSE